MATTLLLAILGIAIILLTGIVIFLARKGQGKGDGVLLMEQRLDNLPQLPRGRAGSVCSVNFAFCHSEPVMSQPISHIAFVALPIVDGVDSATLMARPTRLPTTCNTGSMASLSKRGR